MLPPLLPRSYLVIVQTQSERRRRRELESYHINKHNLYSYSEAAYSNISYYVAGELNATQVEWNDKPYVFYIGDGHYYGGYDNHALIPGASYSVHYLVNIDRGVCIISALTV